MTRSRPATRAVCWWPSAVDDIDGRRGADDAGAREQLRAVAHADARTRAACPARRVATTVTTDGLRRRERVGHGRRPGSVVDVVRRRRRRRSSTNGRTDPVTARTATVSSAPAAPASNGVSQTRRWRLEPRPRRLGRARTRRRASRARWGGARPGRAGRGGGRGGRALVVEVVGVVVVGPRGARRGARRRGGCLAPSPSECTDACRTRPRAGVRPGSFRRLFAVPRPIPDARDWVALTDEPLPAADAVQWATVPGRRRGDLPGVVRDHAEGRPGVVAMTYEAYEGPAERALPRSQPRSGAAGPTSSGRAAAPRSASCSSPRHRSWSSSPRPSRAAFTAAEFAIDTLKEAAPIWKQEHWAGGSDWAVEQHRSGRRSSRTRLGVGIGALSGLPA